MAEEQGTRRLLSRLQEQHELERKAGLAILSYCFSRWRIGLLELEVDRNAGQRAHTMRTKVRGWLQEMRANRVDDEEPVDIDLRLVV